MMDRLRNPWGRPRFLVAVTWLYLTWALLPVAVVMLFSFNDGRSRSTFQGFSMRWWWGDPDLSLFHRADYGHAIAHSINLALLDMAIATPLGTLLALGLGRWRGRGSRVTNLLVLIPLVTPELMTATALLLLFTQLAIVPFALIPLGTVAQLIGQVTVSLPFVVVIIGSRLASIGTQYEEAAADLGASRVQALRLVLLPLLYPAVVASMLIVFALSMDNFVVTQYLSSDQSTATISMYLYSDTRIASTPALNALATFAVLLTLLAMTMAFCSYRLALRRIRHAGSSASHELATLGR